MRTKPRNRKDKMFLIRSGQKELEIKLQVKNVFPKDAKRTTILMWYSFKKVNIGIYANLRVNGDMRMHIIMKFQTDLKMTEYTW